MPLSALIFGAIGTLVETSDLQRQSFNAAFKDADLDWVWTPELYRDLLEINGGQNRIRAYASSQGVSLSDGEIVSLHTRKTDLYEARIKTDGLKARPGVSTLIHDAKKTGIKVGMASTTSPQNIDALFAATQDLSRDDFDFILSGEDVETGKPDQEIYHLAAMRSECLTSEILVIEDTPISAKAATAAELAVAIYPGEMVRRQDMSLADYSLTVDDLSLNFLNTLLD